MRWVRRLRRLSIPAAPGDPGNDAAADEGLSVWENEGGSTSPGTRAASGTLAALLEEGRESAADLALETRRQAQRVRLALGLRRLESRVASEIDGLGHDLFPLLKDGSLRVDLPAIDQRMKVIAELQGQMDRAKARSRALVRHREREEAKRESMAHTDANATDEASAVQSAADEAAEASGQPAELGGEG